MNLLALDYGHRRIGIAYADTQLGVAVAIEAAVDSSFEGRLEKIAFEILRRKIDKLIVGYPYNMDGSAGEKTKEVDGFISYLEEKFNLPVERVDERLTSFQAEQDMIAFGSMKTKSIAARKKQRRSGEVDSRAAAIFLQEYLDSTFPNII